ncbi:hypothetical protein CIB84_014668 [Bambusicola thoracicus]|uniref:Uncharacterized protein n=1 Tax=Bambusicola thoracicus TaxID=9083 RepID=A0A2P4SBT8_BAMTH|nr:hypothetical protein CIB84_014668 [Bambusicola thoracicus]
MKSLIFMESSAGEMAVAESTSLEYIQE